MPAPRSVSEVHGRTTDDVAGHAPEDVKNDTGVRIVAAGTGHLSPCSGPTLPLPAVTDEAPPFGVPAPP
jgi:hypothetical protein